MIGRQRIRLYAGVLAGLMILAGCGNYVEGSSTAPAQTAPTQTPTTATSTPTPTASTRAPSPSPTPTTSKPPSNAYRVEARLAALGYPTGTVDGVITVRTRQALCAWRETHGLSSSLGPLTRRDIDSVLSATERPYADRPTGLYINKTCQILYQVVDHSYRRIVWISTGAAGYDTPDGTGEVWLKRAGWHESSEYEDAWMYDSLYFRGDRPGIALHGSASNSLVRPYPASHGCVRVWRPDIHRIFLETPVGTRVVVYGQY